MKNVESKRRQTQTDVKLVLLSPRNQTHHQSNQSVGASDLKLFDAKHLELHKHLILEEYNEKKVVK